MTLLIFTSVINHCIQDTLSSRAALGLPAAVQPLGRVRRASKGILHTSLITLHSNFEIFQKGHPAVVLMLDRRIFER